MKKFLSVALVLGVLLVGSFAEAKEIQIVNNTGIIVTEIYLSASGTDDWEEDILGGEVLGIGEGWKINIEGPAEWDLKLVGENGAEAVFPGINFNKYKRVTLNKDGNAVGQ